MYTHGLIALVLNNIPFWRYSLFIHLPTEGPLGCFKVLAVKNKTASWDFPGGSVVKNPPANAEDMGSIPGAGRSHRPRSN